jgi:Zn-dependent alcohol dehydrogenase
MAAGVIEQVGPAVEKVRTGDHVVLSWNPHCGHCFYCDRSLPILCEDYLARGARAVGFDGRSKARLASGIELKHLMLDELITRRIRLKAINEGFAALKDGQAIRTVVVFD